jgi:hypothetical protein
MAGAAVSRLRSRIVGQHGAQRHAQAAYHPWGTADTPMVMPMVHVQFGAGGAAVQVMHTIYVGTGTGAVPLAATAPGQFGQVALAGSM